jgi:glutamate synthase (ferredoxin)
MNHAPSEEHQCTSELDTADWGEIKRLAAAAPLYHDRYEHDACGIGFVAQKDGVRSHAVLATALTALCNHAHRGAVAADGKSGDGAGVLTQLPYDLLARHLTADGKTAPEPGDLAAGMVFLPRYNLAHRERARKILEETATEYDMPVVGWRDVPVNGDALGQWAQSLRPYIEQIVLARPAHVPRGAEFERRLYLVRKRATQRAWAESITNLYLPSLSSQTIVYKGLFVAPQLPVFYKDLTDPDYRTAIAVFHQRYSTNTFPTWERAQPFRLLCHNGEINTLQGNLTWMRAREAGLCDAGVWGEDAAILAPVIAPHGSDSAKLDNALDLLVQSGRDIRHAIMMLVPKAWENTADAQPAQHAFYRYHSCLQEPWDGPAALSFTDGTIVGSTLDRNGLRPARFTILDDGMVIMSSEAGAVEVDEVRVVQKGRLRPGEMLAVDTSRGQIENDPAIVARFVDRQPYGEWLERNLVTVDEVRRLGAPGDSKSQATDAKPPFGGWSPSHDPHSISALEAAFGYTREELLVVLRPMWREGREPVGSMGDDTPAAVLSEVPRPLFHHFRQRFAEVTNPPIDSLREETVMSLSQRLGRRGCYLEEKPEAARLLEIRGPVLSDEELAALRSVGGEGDLALDLAGRDPRLAALRTATIDCTWPVTDGVTGLRRAVARACAQAVAAACAGHTLIILSDRAVSRQRAPIPSLLAVSAVHHHLIDAGERLHASLIVESGEPREVHHCAALLGYGANAINPWLAFQAIGEALAEGGRHTQGLTLEDAQHNFVKALEKGILKTMSKMGIATLDSYCGAQIFEAVGLSEELVQAAFAGTENYGLGGITEDDLARDVLTWHRNAFPKPNVIEPLHDATAGPSNGATPEPKLDSYGFYKSRRGGEQHAFSPEVVRSLHEVVGLGRKAKDESPVTNGALSPAYLDYARLVQGRAPLEIRDLLAFNTEGRTPIPLAEVEPVEAIVRRFSTAAMSHGALSAEAHEALTIAMNRLGGASNSGEGGEGPERYGTEGNSRIKQVASGRFGVTPAYLMSADELQIKMAQGSKPGEGGQLPGHKVTAEIARIRHTTPGVALISPPPHHDIYSIEDLAQLIFDLKQANPQATISVKLVAEAGVGTIAAGVAKGHADLIHLSGYNGGTGASPLSSIKNAGAPWEVGLAETQQTLLVNGLRGRVRVRVDGGFKTGRDVVVAALLGADEFSFGTAALVAAGCKMARACHNNTCPVGIATQREDLRAKFPGKPEMVMHFMTQVAAEVRELLASLGAASLDEIIGHTELLHQVIVGAGAGNMDLSPLLWAPDTGNVRRNVDPRNPLLRTSPLGDRLAEDALEVAGFRLQVAGSQPSTFHLPPVTLSYSICNTDRTVGARLSGELARRYGDAGLPEGSIVVDLHGSAGQSFGAFAIHGLTLRLTGQANDYVGKGLAGAVLSIRPPDTAQYVWHHNVILGNTALYGSTAGELYAAGRAGERFAVRNSGARAVVEGVGDHGCEYMTGGVVVVLGRTGRNFGAGMTGGVAYLYDNHERMPAHANTQLVSLHRVERPEHEVELRDLLERHLALTGSPRARMILEDWASQLPHFWRVAPVEQVAALEAANEGVTEADDGEQGNR